MLKNDPTTAPIAPAIHPHINGFLNLKFTPYIAGSVIPNIPVTPADKAIFLVFLFLAFINTPKTAPA